MTQNMNTNVNDNKKKNDADPTTYTAYGDPVKSSLPTINNNFKKATTTIADSTQYGTNRKE